MGLTIHYSGRIADKNKLPQLIEEVEEIAIVRGWKYTIYEREFTECEMPDLTGLGNLLGQHDGKLYGIDFTPKGSEPVSICFLSNGRMSGIMQLACWGEFKEEKPLILYNANISEQGEMEINRKDKTLTADDFSRYLCQCSSKTQYAGPQAHEMIIAVFRYIVKSYLVDFVMVDEAQFWETGDKTLLMNIFNRNTNLINGFAGILKENEKMEDEDLDAYLRRVISNFRRKNK